MLDKQLHFHQSFKAILDSFLNMIISMTWLKASIKSAESFHKNWPYLLTLSCSVTEQDIKIDKSILSLIESEGFNHKTPLYTQTLVNAYRIFTIAVKDIIWNEPDFSSFHNNPEMQFLRHIRNASAHSNQFYWGKENQRKDTISKFPIIWNGKEIREDLEKTSLYMDFFKPGDLFMLLSDISRLTYKK